MRPLSVILFAVFTCWTGSSQTYTIRTIAGNGTAGFSGDNGPATSAQLSGPFGVAVDAAGNLYIADTGNYRVRKVSNGVITTVVGNGTTGFSGDNGPATSARLGSVGPIGVTVDFAGNLYIADVGNQRIREVANGVITTVAGNGTTGFSGDNGLATSAQLWTPIGVAVDAAGDLYIADQQNERIRKVTNGVITTVAGNGIYGFAGDGGLATFAKLFNPTGVAVKPMLPVGPELDTSFYFPDQGNQRIREVANGLIATVAGNGTRGFSGDNGPATSAELNSPGGVAVDAAGNLYIADQQNELIRKVANGMITTIAGNGTTGFGGDGGTATSAALNYPSSVAVDSVGNVYIADTHNNRIRLLTPVGAPTVNPGGIVPLYSAVPSIQPGSWASIFGSNFANGDFIWNGEFPTSLGGVSVTINSKLAYLWLVSPTQINLQAPDDTATGPVSVFVTTPSGTATSTVSLAHYGPSFSLLGDGKHVAAEIPTPNGSGAYGNGAYDLVGPSGTFSFNTRPVKAGEALVLYGVGFGPTAPPVPAGKVFSGSAPTVTPVTVTIGGVDAVVAFAGITQAGLYQINVTIPAGTGNGDQVLQAMVNGVQTPAGPVVTVQ
jgi:uncharacterized protein (TIGR03437 family)